MLLALVNKMCAPVLRPTGVIFNRGAEDVFHIRGEQLLVSWFRNFCHRHIYGNASAGLGASTLAGCGEVVGGGALRGDFLRARCRYGSDAVDGDGRCVLCAPYQLETAAPVYGIGGCRSWGRRNDFG